MFLNAGDALWKNRALLSQLRPKLKMLARTINRLSDSGLSQYAQLFAICLHFKPSLILEVGRAWGNSTAVFTEAANHLLNTRVVSICLTDIWQMRVQPQVTQVVKPEWFAKLKILTQDFLEVPLNQIIKPQDSILFFWDAHGADMAEYVLTRVLPQLAPLRHLILIHDISDVRYSQELKKYQSEGIWKGYIEDCPESGVIINQMFSPFEELIFLHDFTERNEIKLHSVQHELEQSIFSFKTRKREMQRQLGTQMARSDSSLYWFSLNERSEKPLFPRPHSSSLAQISFLDKHPLVSIITPCFNNGQYLESCIKSVLQQDYPYIEHIIQDGASTDETLAVLKKYSGVNYRKRIRWISTPDKGQSDGLDKALKRIRGKIFLVLNADDELLPYGVSWGVRQMDQHPRMAVVYGDEYFIDKDGEIFAVYVGKYPYSYDRLFCVELVPPAQAAFVRTSMFKQVGLYADTSLATCPDFEMWVRLGMKYPFTHEFGMVCKYRHHPGSEGQRPEMVTKMVMAKLQVIQKTLNDPHTPATIKALQTRAYAGLYHWGANVAHSNGLYKLELKLLLQSLLLRPQFHKIVRLTKFLAYHPPNFLFTKMQNFYYV